MAAVWRLPALLAALICYLVLPTSASAGKKPERCDASSSVEAKIEAIQADYEKWAGKCVRIRGIRFDRRLYSSREAILDEVEIYGDPALHSLVIYPDESGLRGQAHWVEVTGRIGSCRTANEIIGALQQQEPDNIIMVSGYCHTSLEHYVRPQRIKLLGGERVLRLTEAEVQPERRRLVEIPATFAVPKNHLETARQLVAAIGSRDEDDYLKLTRPESREYLHRDDINEARGELGDDDLVAQFQLLRNLGRHEQKIFVDRDELANMTGQDSRPPTQLTICWCKSANCKGRWPVGAFDTDNDSARPYLCVETGEWLLGPGLGYVVQAEALAGTSRLSRLKKVRGLAEPDWQSDSAP